jgi:predicted ribonuclease YlaK
MSPKNGFAGGMSHGKRFRSGFTGVAGEKPGLIASNTQSTDRFHKRSSSKDSKKHIEQPKENLESCGKKIVVLDTSVLVHDPESLDILRNEDTILAVPWIVLEELDQLKNKPNIGWDAREVIRRIEEIARIDTHGFKIEPRPTNKHFRNDLQKDKADHQIIATARALQVGPNCKNEVSLMSRDTIVRVLARELGIRAEDYPYNQVNAVFHSSLKHVPHLSTAARNLSPCNTTRG